jgi:hypothetical protein
MRVEIEVSRKAVGAAVVDVDAAVQIVDEQALRRHRGNRLLPHEVDARHLRCGLAAAAVVGGVRGGDEVGEADGELPGLIAIGDFKSGGIGSAHARGADTTDRQSEGAGGRRATARLQG